VCGHVDQVGSINQAADHDRESERIEAKRHSIPKPDVNSLHGTLLYRKTHIPILAPYAERQSATRHQIRLVSFRMAR
jgi:hypothetical protein